MTSLSRITPVALPSCRRWSLLLCVLPFAVAVKTPLLAKNDPPPAPASTTTAATTSSKTSVVESAEGKPAKPGFFTRLFGTRTPKTDEASPKPVAEKHEARIKSYFPDNGPTPLKATRHELRGDEAVEGIFGEVLGQASYFDAPELNNTRLKDLPPVPADFEADWKKSMLQPIWKEQKEMSYPMDKAYASALNNSVQVRSFMRLPKVQETAIWQAKGIFDPQLFAQADAIRTDEPTGSILTTGKTGRFLQDSYEGQYGIRQRLTTGGELSLSHRMSTLDNNSEFLDPNPQTGSEVVLSIAQPLLRGAGADYVRSETRLAQLGYDLAQGESLRLIEDYLLEINRAYWGVYLSRAALAQRQQLTQQTSELLKTLEERQKLDETATISELFRATATMNRRQADMRRSKMAVRTAEQKLRARLKDPEIPMGATGELIPSTTPYLSLPGLDIREISREALTNRSEMAQAATRVRSAAVRRSQTISELRPQLDLVGQAGLAGIAADRDLGSALDDQDDHGVGWQVGLRLSIPWGNTVARARLAQRELEYQQSLDDYRIQGEAVLLETLVAYQDLLTAYQDMAGKYQSVLASRKEIQQLKDRMKLADQDAGKSMAYQIQLLLDAIDRNQVAEEEFLVGVVAYNTTIAQLQRAQGVLLKVRQINPAPVEVTAKAPVEDVVLKKTGK